MPEKGSNSFALKAMESMNQAMATSTFSCMWLLECNSQIPKPGHSVCTLACCRNQNGEKSDPEKWGTQEF